MNSRCHLSVSVVVILIVAAASASETPALQIVKVPDNTHYALGDTISFTIVVSNDGFDTAHNVRFNPFDVLPNPNASLNWWLTSATCANGGPVSCTVAGPSGAIPNGQMLFCSFGNLAGTSPGPAGVCTVVVSSATQASDPADCVHGQGLVNHATVVDDEGGAASDAANQSCPPTLGGWFLRVVQWVQSWLYKPCKLIGPC